MQQTKVDPLELQMQQEKQRRALAKKRAEEKARVRTPDAVQGRQNTEVQTELYLEELTDRVEEADVEVQTDAFLDRPPSPLFIPVKSGTDVWTQIENGELFDFDTEVRPILEVLVGKTLEQALMEVMEEEELSRLRSHQRDFEELRNAELIETQRREEAARRAREEKDRRVRQARDALIKEKETSEKVEARAFAKNYVQQLMPSVFSSLNSAGYFYDQQEREIESVFVPWLLDRVDEKLALNLRARSVLDAILQSVVRTRLEAFDALDPKPAAAEPAAAAPAEPVTVRPSSAPHRVQSATSARAADAAAVVSVDVADVADVTDVADAAPPADDAAKPEGDVAEAADADATEASPADASADAPADVSDAPAAPDAAPEAPPADEPIDGDGQDS